MDTLCKLAPASASDAATMALLSRNLVEYGLPWRWTPDRIRRCVADPTYVVLGARQDQQLAGFAVMEYLQEHAHLCLMAVVPEQRRQGIASQILHWLETTARTAGIFEVILEVRRPNPAALKLYQNHGYTAEKTIRHYYCRGQHALRMRHDLTVSSGPHSGPD